MKNLLFLSLALALLCPRPVPAGESFLDPPSPFPQEEPPGPPLVRLYQAKPPTVDGELFDPCWNVAPTLQPFLTWPNGIQAADATRLMLAYDKSHLFAAFTCSVSDAELLRTADGDPRLNDRVELTLQWGEGKSASVLVDAAGRVRASEALGKVEAAARRGARAYQVEMALPRPEAPGALHVYARRTNEVTGEVSGWGSEKEPVELLLARSPGPVVKVHDVPRYPTSGDPLKLFVLNPTDDYVTVRARVTLGAYDTSLPHLVRLTAHRSTRVELAYHTKDVARRGFRIVFDDPSGRQVYLRAPVIHPPPGGEPRSAVLPVIPHPRSVQLPKVKDEEEEGGGGPPPFVVTKKSRIYIGNDRNRAERTGAARIQKILQQRTGLNLDVREAGFFTSYANAIVLLTQSTAETTTKRLGRKLSLGIPETRGYQSYAMSISPRTVAVLAAEERGMTYAVETLLQLLQTADAGKGALLLSHMRIFDSPAFDLRGCLWRGPRFHHPALYHALARLKLNCLTDTPGTSAEEASARGIFLARLAPPLPPAPGENPGASHGPVLHTAPADDMPRPLRHSLRQPIELLGTGAEPLGAPLYPPPTEEKPSPRRVEVRKGPLVRVRAKPVSFLWVPAEPWPLLHAAAWGSGRKEVVGLCSEVRGSPLLPPSWAAVAAAAEYGWSARVPRPDQFQTTFYRTFYGSEEVGEARRLLERAVASLPRRTALRDLLDPHTAAPSPPREDIAALVQQAKDKAAKATRNQPLAEELARAGGRVLAAATNVRTALRLRQLHAEAAALNAKGKHADVARRLATMAERLETGLATLRDHLGKDAAASADGKLYRSAAAALTRLAAHCAAGERLPEPGSFWTLLRGDAP